MELYQFVVLMMIFSVFAVACFGSIAVIISQRKALKERDDKHQHLLEIAQSQQVLLREIQDALKNTQHLATQYSKICDNLEAACKKYEVITSALALVNADLRKKMDKPTRQSEYK